MFAVVGNTRHSLTGMYRLMFVVVDIASRACMFVVV